MIAASLVAIHLAAGFHTDLDDASGLVADGFTLNQNSENTGPGATYSGGVMTLESTGYTEWILREPDGEWWAHIRSFNGWWIEARLKVVSSTGECGAGFMIADGPAWTVVRFAPGGIHFGNAVYNFDTTDDFHTYRVEGKDGLMTVFVDGVPAFEDVDIDCPLSCGSQVVAFGDLGGCDGSVTEWDHFAYDTYLYDHGAQDDDLDTVTNAHDTCPQNADTDQQNSDGDLRGDACDPCPFDVNDDADHDGACGDVDPCPWDPLDADVNDSGVCDDIECIGCPGPDFEAGVWIANDAGAFVPESGTPDEPGTGVPDDDDRDAGVARPVRDAGDARTVFSDPPRCACVRAAAWPAHVESLVGIALSWATRRRR